MGSLLPGLWKGCKGDLGLGAEFACDLEPGCAQPQGAFILNKSGFYLAQVTGVNAAPDFHSVQGTVHQQMVFEYMQEQVKAGLCHDFTQDYARHHGVAREVPAAIVGVVRNTVRGVAYAVLDQFRTVQKQHGLPVGKVLLNLLSIHCTV